MGHIELARWADMIVIAPATANFIARLSYGLADDLLSTLCLATTAPLLVAPAMNREMWLNLATQENIARLQDRGVTLLGPASGAQACGETGPGRLLEPDEIVPAIIAAGKSNQLTGVRVMVSAGPTREFIDPVRYLSNRSSGQNGLCRCPGRRGGRRLGHPGLRARCLDAACACPGHRSGFRRADAWLNSGRDGLLRHFLFQQRP